MNLETRGGGGGEEGRNVYVCAKEVSKCIKKTFLNKTK